MTTTDLATIPGIEVTPLGLDIDEAIEEHEWAAYGQRLTVAESGLMWALGDWMLHGKTHYGESRANIVASGLNLSPKTLWNAMWVCGAIPQAERRPELSYKHHETVASQPPEVRDAWLARAVDEHLSVAGLVEQIRATALPKPSTPHVGSRRRLPVRFNVTCSLEIPAEIFQEGVHHAAETLRAHLAKAGYEIDLAEVL